jgi:hypothetical protein
MSRSGFRAIAVMSVLAVVLTAAASAGATAGDRAQTEHERITSYWTAARIASAIPRDMVVDRGRAPLAKPPGTPGGGGGGSDDSTAPWEGGGDVQQTTGKVLFTLGSSNYVCSGSAVVDSLSGHSLVLTAGHCVYDDVANAFAANWVFFPAYEDEPNLSCATSSRCFTAAGLVTTEGWADRDFEHDYAFAVIAPRSEEVLLETAYGTQNIAFNQGERLGVYSFGYPHARPYNGNDLIYCFGTAQDDPYGSTTQGLACKMTGGSSGGPWFASFSEGDGTGLLYSVNSYKYQNDKNTMYGPYFGNGTQATYNAANNWSGGNILVNVP